MNVNAKGRTYTQGKSLDGDFRHLIIDHYLSSGGNPVNGYLPVTYKSIADTYCVNLNTVVKIWNKFCDTVQVDCGRKGGGDRCSKLSEGDLEFIEILKTGKGSIQLREIYSILEEVGDTESISLSSISRAVKSKLLSRKQITHIAAERFTPENMIYTQLFIDYLSSKDPSQIKFFDEAGVKMPNVGTRLYGNVPSGERCVEVTRKMESPNVTLNMLISVQRPEYFTLLDGATDTIRFWDFFGEACQAADPVSGRPALDVGDIVVMDNLAVYHYEGGEILQ